MRYLLDTNVVSEASKPTGDSNVREFVRSRRPEDLFISAITAGEIRAGIVRLADGKRRRDLELWFARLLHEYRNRVVAVDASVAINWGDLVARDKNRPVPDGLIAATALTLNLTIVTRNVRDFEWTGVPIINPWLDEVDS